MTQNLRVSAIVLRRVDYGEADRILTVLTRDNGIISVMARGVRREKSRLAGGIELFAICDLSLVRSAQKSGDMWTLTGSKLKKFYDQIMTDYDKLQFGYEAIKIIAKAAGQVGAPEFYDLLVGVFVALDDTTVSLKITQIWLYLQMARLLGNELNLATDQNGMKLVEGAHYDFDTHDQVFSFDENGRYDARAIKLLRVLTSNPPSIAAKIADVADLLDGCLWVAKVAAKA